MVKYVAAAVALKCLSSTSATRSLYRRVSNAVGNSKRAAGPMPAYYLERVKRTLEVANKYQIVRDGDRIIELGTGWLHWEALTLRLFWDVEAVLYDVWDNRQLGGLKNYWGQFRNMLETELGLRPAQLRRARSVLDTITTVDSFEELYAKLGLRYVVETSGSLEQFPNDHFDLAVSAGVFEHIDKKILPGLIEGTHRILRPNGVALHSIDTSDHLSYYDPKVRRKEYLACSEPVWRLLFENKIQYINRVQRADWLDLFKAKGFGVLEEDSRYIDLGDLKLAPAYATMSLNDVSCRTIRLTLQKRPATS
jgi:hypothetical protein